MTIRNWFTNLLLGDVIERGVQERLGAVTVRIDDAGRGPGEGWVPLAEGGPQDRPYEEWLADQEDALEAWRRNMYVRRVISLARVYIVGGGIKVSSEHFHAKGFVQEFIDHPKNRLDRRYGDLCDELIRAGEMFPVLFTNRVDGMSYVRFVPAARIDVIETDPDDYETELRYHERTKDPAGRWWLSAESPEAWEAGEDGRLPPVMLHVAINRPLGATRGESDLGPILRWALRYSAWLEDRVRLNRVRIRQHMLEVEVNDEREVVTRKRALEVEDPLGRGILIHGPGEEVKTHNLEIGASDAESDGKQLRLAIAAGANLALHYFGEGESTNYATAREMGEPTARYFSERQGQFCEFLKDLIALAYERRLAVGVGRPIARPNLRLKVALVETARADNETLARGMKLVVESLALMKDKGWVDDRTAVALAFKFAGEPVSEDEVTSILQGGSQE